MSIFHDKALKGVAEAAAKIMGEQLKGNQHKIDANKNGKVDAHDFKLLRGKKNLKEDDTGYQDRYAVKNGKAVKHNPMRGEKDEPHHVWADSAEHAVRKHAAKTNAPVKEEVELNEAFPTVADAKKRMNAGKTATGSVTKTATGLVHKRDYKDDDSAEDTQKKSTSYGARQNYKRSTRVNEQLSFTEMLELYNEHGLKVLAPIETEEMDIDGTTIEVIDGDKINGYVETTVEEEVTNDEFTKEFEDQKASFEGKKKQPKVAAGKTMGVKTMPEEVELDEVAKWRKTSVAQTHPDYDPKDYASGRSYDYYYDNPRSTGALKATSDTETKQHSLERRPSAQVASQGARKGMITKQHTNRLKDRIKSSIRDMKKEEVELDEEQLDERAKWRTSSIAHNTGYRKDGPHGGIENTADTGKEDLLRSRQMLSRYGTPKKSEVKSLKKSITKNIAQMKKEEVELQEATPDFKTKEDAVKHAKEQVKTHRDRDEGIEIHAHKGGFSVNHTHNWLGRQHLEKQGAKHVGTIYREEVELDERTLTKDEAGKKEDYVKGMKKKLSGFKERYGERAKEVMYATATKMAKKD